jgi:hypothetical protein
MFLTKPFPEVGVTRFFSVKESWKSNCTPKERGIVIMKKLSMIAALAVALVSLPGVRAYADASNKGCERSDGKAKGCSEDKQNRKTRVPEPTSLVLLSTGLLVCFGAVLVFGRKRLMQN